MIRFFTTLFIVTILFSAVQAQLINVNPDKNGEPWYVGGLRVPSQAEIDRIPVVPKISTKDAKVLPASHDNSENMYFRPIFNQDHGSCAQASGIAYTFTYEMNRLRGTDASLTQNQFPSHYTYNFLNYGSGDNGSWYQDGWDIIAANGCPTVETYGGISNDANYWMSGYDKYDSGQNYRVSEYFAFDLSSAEGLETFKQWLYDGLDGSAVGGIANFAAGINNDDYNMTWTNIITRWGYTLNHAMTFVGWDDDIEYDFNNDGQITNNEDINGDGIVNMQDWERGALVMVNSWGEYWGNQGKAYVMYKLLADPIEEGGIFQNKAFAIRVQDDFSPKLKMKVKMQHNSRSKIQIRAGIATDTDANLPEHEMQFPLFNRQGGDFDMRGTSTEPIEFVLDITPLLSHCESGQQAQIFLIVDEYDPYGEGTGQVIDFSVINNGNASVCNQHNVSINNNTNTYLFTDITPAFSSPQISEDFLPVAESNQAYSYQLNASGGESPYEWSIEQNYTESSLTADFPSPQNQLTPNSDDDGYVAQSLDFSFPFYGESYNEVFVLTDGSILFSPGFNYLRDEEAIIQTKMIAVFASDLKIFPQNGDGIFYEGNSQKATFRWKTALYGDEFADVDAAVELYPDGTIKFFYGDYITEGLSWASGISNGDEINYEIAEISGNYSPGSTRHQFIPSAFPMGMHLDKYSGIFSGTPQGTDSYQIEFVVTDASKISKSKVLDFNVNPSYLQEADNENFSVYPIPASDKIIFEVENQTASKAFDIEIYNAFGKKISEMSGRSKLVFRINNSRANGIYFYKILSDGTTIQSGKFMVKK